MGKGCPNCNKDTKIGFAPGTVLPPGYVIDRLLAQGGMANIYLATDPSGAKVPVGQHLVVKEMFEDDDPNQHAKNIVRFEREATILQTLVHPRIPKGFGYFQVPLVLHSGDRVIRHCMAMERLHGKDVLAYMVQDAPNRKLDVLLALDVAIQTCDGLRAMHSFIDPVTGVNEPIVHRDMKPENLMIVVNAGVPDVKITDLGAARRMKQSAGTIARKTQIISEGYWAPEQLYWKGRTPDGRTDIYGLAATVYTMLNGQPLEDDFKGRLAEVLTLTDDNVQHLFPVARLHGVLTKALQPVPEDRYQTVTEFRSALEGLYGLARPLPQHLMQVVPVHSVPSARFTTRPIAPAPTPVSPRQTPPAVRPQIVFTPRRIQPPIPQAPPPITPPPPAPVVTATPASSWTSWLPRIDWQNAKNILAWPFGQVGNAFTAAGAGIGSVWSKRPGMPRMNVLSRILATVMFVLTAALLIIGSHVNPTVARSSWWVSTTVVAPILGIIFLLRGTYFKDPEPLDPTIWPPKPQIKGRPNIGRTASIALVSIVVLAWLTYNITGK